MLNLLYILLTVAVLVVFGLLDENVDDIYKVVGSLNSMFILAAAGALLLQFIIDGMILKYIMSYLHKGMGYFKALKLAIIGYYYSALTPFSSGGQPMQVYYMYKDDIPVGKSTCCFSVKFLSFQVSLCLYFVVSIVWKGTRFFSQNPGIITFTIIGFIANALITAAVLIVLIDKFPVKDWARRLIGFLHRIYIVKDAEKAVNTINKTIDDYLASAEFIRSEKRLLLGSMALELGQMFARFSITFFIYRSFDLSERSLMDVVAMQAFHYLAVCFVPIPGAAIASEGGFYLFFKMFFPDNIMFVAMLIWRLFTYYAHIIIGAFVVLGDTVHNMIKDRPASDKPESLR